MPADEWMTNRDSQRDRQRSTEAASQVKGATGSCVGALHDTARHFRHQLTIHTTNTLQGCGIHVSPARNKRRAATCVRISPLVAFKCRPRTDKTYDGAGNNVCRVIPIQIHVGRSDPRCESQRETYESRAEGSGPGVVLEHVAKMHAENGKEAEPGERYGSTFRWKGAQRHIHGISVAAAKSTRREAL